MHLGLRTSKKHWEKVDLAIDLNRNHNLPDVTDLLGNLNNARKAAAYGTWSSPTSMLRILRRRSNDMSTPSPRCWVTTMNESRKQPGKKWPDVILRWPTETAKEWTTHLLCSAQSDNNVMAIVAVGSAVRPSVMSADLDLIVVCRELAQSALKPPIEVDLRAYAASEIDGLIEDGNDMLGWAVKFGRVLYQRERFWDAVLTKWQRRLPMPSADAAARRAEEAFQRLTKVFELGDRNAAHEQAVSYLTHAARAELLRKRVYPASRPELPKQLRVNGFLAIARSLERLLERRYEDSDEVASLIQGRRQTRG